MSVKSVSAVINGQTYNLTYNSSTGKYEATITAPAVSSYSQEDHKFNVALTATDVAGNSTTIDKSDETFGSQLQLRVLEKVAPVIADVSPSSGAYIVTDTPTITFKITDNDSGVDTSKVVLKINGTQVPVADIEFTATTGGYTASYTVPNALAQGSNTITIVAEDFDGNVCDTVTSTFTVDTVAPELDVTSPEDGLITNEQSLTVAGTTSDATSGPVTIKISLNGTDQGDITVDGTGAFSKVVTLANGSNEIIVTATDQAGKTSTVTRTVVLDQAAPVFTSVSIVPNPVDAGATYVISVEVTDT